MGLGAVLEPLVVVTLLFGGTWINRSRVQSDRPRRKSEEYSRSSSPSLLESGRSSSTDKVSLLRTRSISPESREAPWRKRHVRIFRSFEVTTPNTAVFEDRLLSRLLRRLPFLVECWYWALIYWTYQLGRALTAVLLQDGTIDVARKHALQVIDIEQKLGIFWEVSVQQFFLRHSRVMTWINWTYSFIHIPGSIAFLVWLYYFTTTRNRLSGAQLGSGSPAGPSLYQARRRTLAVCNLLAFVVFTLWPCMPPRLLSDESVEGAVGDKARSYGFVDTVHGVNGASSVWTANKFCNQYAAMPSLHFGYSLMIGLTIMTIPLPSHQRRSISIPLRVYPRRLTLPSWRRLACLVVGFAYPALILVAIVATANHFILDAVAGALICGLGWKFNWVLLNLLPLEDYFLCLARIHKPDLTVYSVVEDWDDGHTVIPS